MNFLKNFFRFDVSENSPTLAQDLENLGLNKKMAILAVIVTLVVYLFFNAVLRVGLWYQASQGTLIQASGDTAKADLANRYIQMAESPKSLLPWVTDSITTTKQSTSDLVVRLVQSVKGNSKDAPKMEKKLRQLIQGNPKWIIFLFVSQPTGSEALAEITHGADGSSQLWMETLDNDALGKEKKQFLVQLLNLLISKQSGLIHTVNRLNGWIQILTVYLGILAICLMRRRWLLVNQVRTRMTVEPLVGGMLPEQERAEACIYKPINYIISMLPSLGFIGTVLGMGQALLHANTLFSSSDKQAAIGEMTRQLGFAFDTTLVALVVAIILGTILTKLQTSESRLRFEISEKSQAKFKPITGDLA